METKSDTATTPERPRRLRRLLLRRILPGLGALILIAAALIAYKGWSNMKGPPPPECAGAPLPRKTFEPPRQLSSAQTPGARLYDVEPSAALLPDGSLAVVYNARDSFFAGTSGLVVGRIGVGGEVTLAPYPTDRAEAFDAWMTAAPDGKVRIAWLAHDGGRPERNMKIGYAESADGIQYSPPAVGHAPSDCPEGTRGCLDKPMIAADGKSVYVAYYSDPGGGLRVTRGDLAGPGLPSLPSFQESVLTGEGAYADIFVAPSGALHLAVIDFLAGDVNRFGDKNLRVAYTRSEDGGKTFTPIVRVSRDDEQVPFFFSNPQVTVDEQRGFLYIAWPSGTPDGRWDINLATSPDGGKTWSRIKVNDDAPCASHMTPHTALDPKTGTLHVTWLENRTGTGGL
ncbi:MAG TPA: sialidase family protein, partial [Candidatus Nanopelagicales bacterium]|nr:sialidase family protein [Candidatus Nanopelagicales bacterium]